MTENQSSNRNKDLKKICQNLNKIKFRGCNKYFRKKMCEK